MIRDAAIQDVIESLGFLRVLYVSVDTNQGATNNLELTCCVWVEGLEKGGNRGRLPRPHFDDQNVSFPTI